MNASEAFTSLSKDQDELERIAGALHSYSKSFAVTGNTGFSETIFYLAERISAIAEDIGKGSKALVDSYVSAVDDGSNNMLQAALISARIKI